jgi:hypothetical protein
MGLALGSGCKSKTSSEVVGVDKDGVDKDGDSKKPTAQLQVSKKATAQLQVNRLQHEGYATWSVEHPGTPCPSSIDDLGSPGNDPWGNPYRFTCDGRVSVSSSGPDGKPGTPDDIVAK